MKSGTVTSPCPESLMSRMGPTISNRSCHDSNSVTGQDRTAETQAILDVTVEARTTLTATAARGAREVRTLTRDRGRRIPGMRPTRIKLTGQKRIRTTIPSTIRMSPHLKAKDNMTKKPVLPTKTLVKSTSMPKTRLSNKLAQHL